MALIFDGLVVGLQLSMLAVGLTLSYGLSGVLNLAHGQFVTVTAIVAAVLVGNGFGVFAALAIALSGAAVLSLVLDRTVLLPVYRRQGGERVLLSLLLTLGVAFLIDGVLSYYYPLTTLSLSVPWPSVGVLGVTMRSGSIIAAAIALAVLAALSLFLTYARRGRAVRSMIQDEEGAQLCGISPGAVRTAVFVLSGVLAGLVAVTQGLVSSVSVSDGVRLTIMALIVAVVGGLGSVSGALLAGVLLGIVHTLSSSYIGSFYTFVILLGVAMLTILVRPAGLLGKEASR